MRDGGLVLPPGGWMLYCSRVPVDADCRSGVRRGPSFVNLDEKHWRELESVMRETRHIRKVPDGGSRWHDDWRVAREKGDCEDIALAARAMLLAAGWPIDALRLATAWTETGEPHTVLTIEAVNDGVRGTWVIDSRMYRVVPWEELVRSGYRFSTRQASRGPTWVAIES